MDIPKLIISYSDLKINESETAESFEKIVNNWPKTKVTDVAIARKDAYRTLVNCMAAPSTTFRHSYITFIDAEFKYQYNQIIKILDKYNVEYSSFIN